MRGLVRRGMKIFGGTYVIWPATASPGNRCSTGEDVGGAHWTGGWESPQLMVYETVWRRGGGLWHGMADTGYDHLAPMRLELGSRHHRARHLQPQLGNLPEAMQYWLRLPVVHVLQHCPAGYKEYYKFALKVTNLVHACVGW